MTSPPSPAHGDLGEGGLPGRVRLAVASAAAVGILLVGYGIFLAAHWVVERPDEPMNAALLIGLSLLWGVGVLLCARGLAHRRRWALAPVVTSALLVVAVGWLLASGHEAEVAVGWAVLVLGVACLVAAVAAGRDLS